MHIDFDRYIADRTLDYSPRPWIFERIARWLANPGLSRYFLLTAKPGSGKTAIAAQAVNVSRGVVTGSGIGVPNGSIAAHHFCYAREGGSLEPMNFSESISDQLAATIPAFCEAVRASQPEARVINANVTMDTGDVSGSVTGLAITVVAATPLATFTRAVRTPLVRLYESGFDRDIVILIDALDEARLAGPGDTIFSLIAACSEWPPRVRFLVTARPDEEIVGTLERNDPHLVHESLSSGKGKELSDGDIRRYLAATLPKGDVIGGKLTANFSLDHLADVLAQKAEGNFLWTRYALTMLADIKEPIALDDLEALPGGLRPLYLEFLQRVARADPAGWESRHARVLGVLVVAQEGMDVSELASWTELKDAVIFRVVKDLGQLLDATGGDEEPRYSLYHRSFADFLLDPLSAHEFHCDETDGHRRIAAIWSQAIGGVEQPRWRHSAPYALRNIATHLFALRSEEPMRRHLYSLASRDWMALKRETLGEDASFANDLMLISEAAAERREDISEEIRATAILTALRSRAASVPSEALVLLARFGELDRARQYLSLAGNREAKLRVVCEMADAILERNPADAEALLRESLHAAPSEISSNAARSLRAIALALLGRFDDVLPLLSPLAFDWQQYGERLARIAASSERDDIVELALASTKKDDIVETVTATALEQRRWDRARQWALRLPVGWQRDSLLIRIAKAAHAVDVDFAAATVGMTENGYRRNSTFVEILAAAADDIHAREFIARLPKSDAEDIIANAVTMLGSRNQLDLADRLAQLGDRRARQAAGVQRVMNLVAAGDVDGAMQIVDASAETDDESAFTHAFAEAAALHASPEVIARTLHPIEDDPWAVKRRIDEVLEKRGAAAMVELLAALGDEATQRTRSDAIAALVKRRERELAFGVVAGAPEAMREALLRNVCAVAQAVGDLDAVWRVYELAPEAASVSTDLLRAFVAADRLDEARALLDRVPYANEEALRILVRAYAAASRVDDAVALAESAQQWQRDTLLANALAMTPVADLDSAVRLIRESASYFGTIPQAATLEAARSRRVDDALSILDKSADQSTNILSIRVAVALDLFEHGDSEGGRRVAETTGGALPWNFVSSSEVLPVAVHLIDAGELTQARRWAERDWSVASGTILAGAAERFGAHGEAGVARELITEAERRVYRADAPFLANLALAYEAIGETAKALGLVEQAVLRAQNQQSPELARAVARLGSPEAAASYADDPEVLAEVAAALAARGAMPAAREALTRALEKAKSIYRDGNVASVLLAALRILPRDEVVAMSAGVTDSIGYATLLEKAARSGQLEDAYELARAIASHPYRVTSAVQEALQRFAARSMWNAALFLARTAEDRCVALHDILRFAEAEGTLAGAVQELRSAGIVPDERLASRMLGEGSPALRLEVARLVGADGDHLRQSLAEELTEQGELSTAFEIATLISDPYSRLRAAAAVMAASTRSGILPEWFEPRLENLALEDRNRLLELAFREMIEAGLPVTAFAYAKLMTGGWERSDAARMLAEKGLLDSAVELADSAGGYERNRILAVIAAAAAEVSPGRAVEIMRRIPDRHYRQVAWIDIVSKLVAAGLLDAARDVMSHDREFRESIEAKTQIAKSFFSAGATDEARRLIDEALTIVNTVEDVWIRNATISKLAQFLARTGIFTEAMGLVALIPADDEFRGWATLTVAREQARVGDTVKASEIANAGMAEARRVRGAASWRQEGYYAATLASLGGRHRFQAVVDDMLTASSTERVTHKALALIELAGHAAALPWWLPQPTSRVLLRVKRWWWQLRGRRRALWLVRVAEREARQGSDEVIRLQTLAIIAANLGRSGRRDEALSLAREVDEAIRDWHISPAKVIALSNIGRAYVSVGQADVAGGIAQRVIEALLSVGEQRNLFIPQIAKLITALGAPGELIDRLLDLARIIDDGSRRDPIVVATSAAAGDPKLAARIGALLSRAAAECGQQMVRPLCEGLLAIAEVTKDQSFAEESWALTQRLEQREASDFFPIAARRLAEMRAPSARRWIDAGLAGLRYAGPAEGVAPRRATIAVALLRVDDKKAAWKEMRTAIAESRIAGRETLFYVLRELIDGLDRKGPLPRQVAAILLDTESWWQHRRSVQ